MKILIVLTILSIVSAIVPLDRLAAQGRDSRDDGAAARTDAILGTPNRTTPVPQTNMFSTVARPGAASARVAARRITRRGQRTQ